MNLFNLVRLAWRIIRGKPPWYEGTQLTAKTPTWGWYTFLHHQGPIIEYSDNVVKRLDYIRAWKPKGEIPIRLQHIAYVDFRRIPQEYMVAVNLYDTAQHFAVTKGSTANDDGWAIAHARLSDAKHKYQGELTALAFEHVPDCYWDPLHETIFKPGEEFEVSH